tara:strand:+ start:4140 stop:5270 length:1131 start_codon:yes stop_codon:yes gene_type:complete
MTKAAELAKMGEVLTNSQIGGRRNIVINGAMQIFQRATSATAVSSGYTTVDRFRGDTSTDGAFTTEKSTDNPFGTGNSLKCQVTTADTSLSGTQFSRIIQRIEAQNLQQLSYGTSSAKTLALSFWVKSNKTGIYSILLRKPDNTAYHFIHEYTISSANTWEQKEIIITPTAGSTSFITASAGAIDNDNGIGLELSFGLGQGSTYAIGTSNTWSSDTNTYASSNQVNWMDSTSNNFYLTQVQLEVGSQATPFEHRSFGEELLLCQRYCFDINPASGAAPNSPYIMSCAVYNSTIAISHVRFPVEMRATPTTTLTGAAADFSIYEGATNRVCTGFAANGLSSVGGGMNWTVNAGGMTTSNAGNVYIESNKRAPFDAEL